MTVMKVEKGCIMTVMKVEKLHLDSDDSCKTCIMTVMKVEKKLHHDSDES